MAPGSSRRLKSATVLQSVDSTPSSELSNPNTPMHSATPTSSAASTTRKKGRGLTRGKGLQKIIKTTGKKLIIEISKEKGRPLEHDQSAKLSNELGIICRNLIPVPTKWKALCDEDKQVGFERLNNEMKHLESLCTPDEGTPLSPDEIVDHVLGTRPGYIKGLGHGPKPSTSTRTLKQKNSELEEALKESTRIQQNLMERLAAHDVKAAVQGKDATIQQEEAASQRASLQSQRETVETILAQQAESNKLIQSLIASRVIPRASCGYDWR